MTAPIHPTTLASASQLSTATTVTARRQWDLARLIGAILTVESQSREDEQTGGDPIGT